jgi:DeoR/GlpR family transcriptional regulator of sugar metabolism
MFFIKFVNKTEIKRIYAKGRTPSNYSQNVGNQSKGFVVELSEILNVSDDTIRRDLNEWPKNGLLKKCTVVLFLGRRILQIEGKNQRAHEEKMVLAQKHKLIFMTGK